MEAFTTLEAVAAPLDRANVDTDAIIPKQFMKSITRTGFGDNLFDEWRYLDHGEPGMDCSKRPVNPDFVLNQPPYRGARILLARENFGCGSSREHAPWALADYGFRAIVAPSFADIFHGNCFTNGILPIVLPAADVESLFDLVEATPGCTFSIDLAAQTVTPGAAQGQWPGARSFHFEVDAFRKHCLLNGLDPIALTLRHEKKIRAYEAWRIQEEPWLFPDRGGG